MDEFLELREAQAENYCFYNIMHHERKEVTHKQCNVDSTSPISINYNYN